mgnify:CR=1 FL=1
MSNFGKAPIKCEGMMVDYDESVGYVPTKPKVETTYVERRVPEHLEDKAHKLIDKFLRKHGYDPEEI